MSVCCLVLTLFLGDFFDSLLPSRASFLYCARVKMSVKRNGPIRIDASKVQKRPKQSEQQQNASQQAPTTTAPRNVDRDQQHPNECQGRFLRRQDILHLQHSTCVTPLDGFNMRPSKRCRMDGFPSSE
ncbi:hypothetical protein BJ741DRAFT_46335 [Chytriomyces cf. hyalinus JEL632]|nr:hypothetical protein BJ741DRAFT_46335 [Chytriomyces cf. hyalinus JEL632]